MKLIKRHRRHEWYLCNCRILELDNGKFDIEFCSVHSKAPELFKLADDVLYKLKDIPDEKIEEFLLFLEEENNDD